MEKYHDKTLVVQTCENFPQQANTYDCGMFMLCGIKDVVFDRKWTFQQKDMNERRLEVAS
jgi:Ulp1 family protease